MLRSVGGWLSVVGLAVLVSACTGGGGGGGGSSNEAPVAVDDVATTSEDTPVSINVLANDTDADADDLVFVSTFTDAANGTVSVDFDGTISYEPDPDFSGSDTFSYTITDGRETATANVAVTVSTIGDNPVTVADAYAATEDVALVVAAATGVLANDDDVDSPGFTAVLDNNAADGTVALAADGSFTYTPDANFNGSDSFTYHATDGTQDSSIVVVTITVAAVNDAPVAVNDAGSGTEDTLLIGTTVLANDTDVEGSTLSVQLVGAPANGTLSLAAAGTYSYVPNANTNGADSFTYRVTDGTAFSNTATVSLTIGAVNDVPLAVADAYVVAEDGTLAPLAATGVLANDSDVEGSGLTAVLVAPPASGTFALAADGSFTYTPALNFVGGVSFTYTANDAAPSATTTVAITVTAVNDAPVAVNDAGSGTEDTVLNGATVLGNDTDVEGSTLSAQLVSGPTQGTVTLAATGTYTYVPNANTNGADSFQYAVTDGTALSNTATVTLTIAAVNDVPVAVADSFSLTEDTPFSSGVPGVLANDSDVEGAVFAVLVSSATNAAAFTLNANGSFNYTPSANFSGVSTFTYRVQDLASVLSPTVTVTLNVGAVNDAPVADADGPYSTNEDTLLTVLAANGVLAGDTDVDGNPLHVVLVSGPANGTLTLAADGSFTFQPAANVISSSSFTYRASDGVAESGNVTVTLNINSINDAPVAVADAYSTTEDTPLTVTAPGVLANDTDVDDSTRLVQSNTSASNGSVAVNADGSFTYTPNANFNGTDSFTYRATDLSANSGFVTVSLNVISVNDAPTFTGGGNVTRTEDSSAYSAAWAGSISKGAANESAQTLTFSVVAGNPAAFSVQPLVSATGVLTFTPAPNFFGSTPVTVSLSDSEGGISPPVVFQIILTNVNDAPEITLGGDRSVLEDSAFYSESGFASFTAGPNGEPELYTVQTQFSGAVGALFANDCSLPNCGFPNVDLQGTLTFKPAPNISGSVPITIQVTDNFGLQSQQNFLLSIDEVNDAPSFTKGPGEAAFADGVLRTRGTWATNMSPGPNEGSQTWTFAVFGYDSTLLTQIAIDPSGTLTYTPNSAGLTGQTTVSVLMTDDGVPALDSVLQTFEIAIVDQPDPPAFLSSLPVQGDLISYDEAFGSGGQMNPAVVTFNDPELDCGAIVIDINRSQSGPMTEGLDYSRYCDVVNYPGQLFVYFGYWSTDPDGEDVSIALSNVHDGNALNLMLPEPLVISFRYDPTGPTPSFVDDLSNGNCRPPNTRAIARFDEPIDETTASTFRFDRFPNGPGGPGPVAVEPDDLPYRGSGFAALDVATGSDTYFYVPQDLLDGANYEVDFTGFRDLAGNPASIGVQQFNVCGSGPGGPGGLQLSSLVFTDGATVETIPSSEIVNGFTLVGSAIGGTTAELDIAFNQALVAGGGASVRYYDSASGFEQYCGGSQSGSTFHLEPATCFPPGFQWSPGIGYTLEFNVCAQSGDCTGGRVELMVQFAGDSTNPRLTAITGGRASDTVASRPVVRPEEIVRLGFSEPIDRRTLVAANFRLEDSTATVIPVVLIDEEQQGGLGAARVALRADRGDGLPGALAEGLYTLTVTGLLDFGDPQNGFSSVQQRQFEVASLSGAPSIFGFSVPWQGGNHTELDPDAPTLFFYFDDAMSRSSFVDTGAPASRGFRFEEQLTGSSGSARIPLKGLSPFQQQGCCNGSGIAGAEPQVVPLTLPGNGCCGPSQGGFREGGDYFFTALAGLRSADGVAMGVDSSEYVFSMTDAVNGGEVRPTFTEFSLDMVLFPPNALRYFGGQLESFASVDVRFEDQDVNNFGEQESLTLFSETTLLQRDFGPSTTTEFSGNNGTFLDPTAISDLFVASAFNQIDFFLSDDFGNESVAIDYFWVPAAPPTPVASYTGPTLTVSGSIPAPDALFTDSVEIGIFITDDSFSPPNIIGGVASAFAQVSRDNVSGDLTYVFSSDQLSLPDISPLTYRAAAVAYVPSHYSGTERSVRSFSGPSAPIPPNEPPGPVSVSGNVTTIFGSSAGAGALVEVVGANPVNETFTDAAGGFVLSIVSGQTVFLRATGLDLVPPHDVGTQTAVTVLSGGVAGLELQVFRSSELDPFLYSPFGDTFDPGKGIVNVAPGVGFTADLSLAYVNALSFDNGTGAFVPGNTSLSDGGVMFTNVDAGLTQVDLTPALGETCVFNPPLTEWPVDPGIFTFIAIECIAPPPSFDIGGDRNVAEGSGAFVEAGYAFNLATGPGAFFFSTFSDNPGLFNDGDCSTQNCGQPFVQNDGTLTFFPNAFTSGTATVTVTLQQGDGQFATRQFDITVTNVNQSPSFTAGPGQVHLANVGGAVTVNNWASNISQGPGEFGPVTLSFVVTDDDLSNTFLTGTPTVDAGNGTLQYTRTGTGGAGTVVVTVTLHDDGGTPGVPADDAQSAPQMFTITLHDPSMPAVLVSSSPFAGESLNADEAFGSGQRLNPAILNFSSPDLNCGATTITVTRNGSDYTGSVTKDCSQQGSGRIRLDFANVATSPDGDDFVITATNIVQAGGPTNAGPIAIPFTYDSEAPIANPLVDLSGCPGSNTRAIFQFSETMSPASASEFEWNANGFGGAAVIGEPGGVGFASLNVATDLYYFVPRDLLAGGGYTVDLSGLTDLAGNAVDEILGFGPGSSTLNLNICGGGGGGGTPGPQIPALVGIGFGPNGTDYPVAPTEIANGTIVVDNQLDGTQDELHLFFDNNLSSGGGNLNFDGFGSSGSIFGNELVFSIPATWEAGRSYGLNFSVCDFSSCNSANYEIVVKGPSESTKPTVTAVVARRADASAPSVALLRPHEPLLVGISEAIDPRTLGSSNVFLTGASGDIPLLMDLDEDCDGIQGCVFRVRATDGFGNAAALAPGSYSLTVQGLRDLSQTQNTMAPIAPFPIEVLAQFPGTPASLVSTSPLGGETLDASSLGLFLTFSDLMVRESFVDAGNPAVTPRGFLLEEGLTGGLGTIWIPLKGLAPGSNGCCSSNNSPTNLLTSTVSLVFSQNGGPVEGFQYGRSYRFTPLAGLRNADDVPIGSAGATVAFETAAGALSPMFPTLSEMTFAGTIVEADSFTCSACGGGGPFVSTLTTVARFYDSQGGATFETLISGGGGPTPSTPCGFAGTCDVTYDFAAPPAGDYVITYRITDTDSNQTAMSFPVYVPDVFAAPNVTVNGSTTVTVSGTIGMPDAAAIGSVSIGIFVTDDSSGTPDIVGQGNGGMAALTRDATGLTYTLTFDQAAFPPKTAAQSYRALAYAAVPNGQSTDGFNDGPAGTIDILVLGPVIPVAGPPTTISGFVHDFADVPVQGATVVLVGTSSSTSSDASGNWSMNVPPDTLGYVRATLPGYHGSQILVRTANGLNVDNPVLLPTEVQQFYDVASGSTTTVLPAAGSVFLSRRPGETSTIGLASADEGAVPAIGQAPEGYLFMNVTPGDATFNVTDITGTTCGVYTGFQSELTPLPLNAAASVLTILQVNCPVVTISGNSNDGQNPTSNPVADVTVELMGVGISTISDVNGNWSMQVPENYTNYLRQTKAGLYGFQTLLRTQNGMNLGFPIFTPADVQGFYDGAGAVGPVIDVGAGTIYIEPNPSVPFTADLGTLTFFELGTFGGNEQLFQNVSPGSSILTLSGGDPCSVFAFGASLPSPVSPFEVAPNTLTYVPMECSP